MSEYFYNFQSLQATQYQIVIILAMLGAVWGASWLLIDKVVPARWRVAAQWVYILLAAVLGAFTLIKIGG